MVSLCSQTLYGYCINLKITVKTRQTRTREWKSTMGFLHLKYAQKKHKDVTSWVATLAIRVKQRSDPTALGKHPMIRGMKGRDQEERVTDFGA
ncbi:hypothetical protein Tco_0582577 [Tanacetum coccineum]